MRACFIVCCLGLFQAAVSADDRTIFGKVQSMPADQVIDSSRQADAGASVLPRYLCPVPPIPARMRTYAERIPLKEVGFFKIPESLPGTLLAIAVTPPPRSPSAFDNRIRDEITDRVMKIYKGVNPGEISLSENPDELVYQATTPFQLSFYYQKEGLPKLFSGTIETEGGKQRPVQAFLNTQFIRYATQVLISPAIWIDESERAGLYFHLSGMDDDGSKALEICSVVYRFLQGDVDAGIDANEEGKLRYQGVSLSIDFWRLSNQNGRPSAVPVLRFKSKESSTALRSWALVVSSASSDLIRAMGAEVEQVEEKLSELEQRVENASKLVDPDKLIPALGAIRTELSKLLVQVASDPTGEWQNSLEIQSETFSSIRALLEKIDSMKVPISAAPRTSELQAPSQSNAAAAAPTTSQKAAKK